MNWDHKFDVGEAAPAAHAASGVTVPGGRWSSPCWTHCLGMKMRMYCHDGSLQNQTVGNVAGNVSWKQKSQLAGKQVVFYVLMWYEHLNIHIETCVI